MFIKDEIYGNVEVDGVLEELLTSKEILRLKNIHQGGASYLVNPLWNVTRYDHSVGVMILIGKLGGTLEEQIAGLLHDISHTVFSHLIDSVFDNEKEDYHEKIFEELVEQSEVKKILINGGYDYKKILLDHSSWPLLEKDLPYLSADRIDYTLRDLYRAKEISREEIENFLGGIENLNGEIIIKNKSLGIWFVRTYYKEVIDYFRNSLNIYASNRLGEAIKIALAEKLITEKDFLKTDDYVYSLLEQTSNKNIINLLNQLKNPLYKEATKEDYDIEVKGKVRMVDPLILNENKLMKISDVAVELKSTIEKVLEISKEGVYLKLL